jgi:alpha-amylase
VRLTFQLKQYKCAFGEQLGVVGSIAPLGAWQSGQLLPMEWGEGDTWTATVEVPARTAFEYKYVVFEAKSNTVCLWEPGTNMYQRGFSAEALVTRAWGQSISKISYLTSRLSPSTLSPPHF